MTSATTYLQSKYDSHTEKTSAKRMGFFSFQQWLQTETQLKFVACILYQLYTVQANINTCTLQTNKKS